MVVSSIDSWNCHQRFFIKSFKVISLALGQSHNCPNTNETTWKITEYKPKKSTNDINSLRPHAYMRQWSNHHRFRYWLVAWSAPSHYLNQCRNIVNWTLENKLQWNFNQNSNIFIQENALKNDVCETASILSQPQCVNTVKPKQSDHWIVWSLKTGGLSRQGRWISF